jgi:hypothetical protein
MSINRAVRGPNASAGACEPTRKATGSNTRGDVPAAALAPHHLDSRRARPIVCGMITHMSGNNAHFRESSGIVAKEGRWGDEVTVRGCLEPVPPVSLLAPGYLVM